MARRADPARIFMARRTAVRNGLTDHGTPQATAQAWCDAWEVEAELTGIRRDNADYRMLGESWIAEQRKTRKLPT